MKLRANPSRLGPMRSTARTSALLLALTLIGATAALGQDCVDLNTASAGQLQRIIHIGPERARQIITLRAQRPFASVDDIVRVKGIAAARLRDIKAQGLACVRRERRLVAGRRLSDRPGGDAASVLNGATYDAGGPQLGGSLAVESDH